MKRKKTRAPQADADEIAAIRSGLHNLPAPREPFDFHERARAAEEARRLYFAILEIHRQFLWNTDATEGYELAQERYHEAIMAAYPPEFGQDLKNLRAGDSSGMGNILSFLEADPIFYRTVFLKQKLGHWIKPEMLTPSDAARLRRIILSVVDRRHGWDFGGFCRLARKVDSPEMRQGLHLRLDSDDPLVRRRARWMLNFLETNNTRKE